MERRKGDGRKRPPDRQPVLLSRFREVIQQVSREQGGRIFIGGKSMGGRMASLLAAEPDLTDTLAGCLCFGYPFHPPGKTERWRVKHFDKFHCPVMIVQGTRDPFGKQEEVRHHEALSGWDCGIHWLEGGDHDFNPLARQPETQEMLIDNAAKAAAAFMVGHC
jgi:predicted alpha/beta-hydrolase family hydrolase